MSETIRIKDSNGKIKTLYEVLPPSDKLEKLKQKVSKLYVVPQKPTNDNISSKELADIDDFKPKSQNVEPTFKEIEKIVFVEPASKKHFVHKYISKSPTRYKTLNAHTPQTLQFEINETTISKMDSSTEIIHTSTKHQKDKHPYIKNEDTDIFESKNHTPKTESTVIQENFFYLTEPTEPVLEIKNDLIKKELVPKSTSPVKLLESKPIENENYLKEDIALKQSTNNQTFFEIFKDPKYFHSGFINPELSEPISQSVKTFESKPFDNRNVLQMNDKPIEKKYFEFFQNEPDIVNTQQSKLKSSSQLLPEIKSRIDLQEKNEKLILVESGKKHDDKQQKVINETIFIKNEPMTENETFIINESGNTDAFHVTKPIWPWFIFLPLVSILLSVLFFLVAFGLLNKTC